MDQCFAIDHSYFILERQAVRLTVYRDEGNKITKAFLSQRVSVLGKEWKIVFNPATDTHCIYLVRT